MGMYGLIEAERRVIEDELIKGLSKTCVPLYMHKAIIAYVVEHRKPGHFLTAVLENDLRESVGHADERNEEALSEWVMLLYNYVPSVCWGSPAKVEAWVDQGVDGVEKGNGI